jgi:hypothetical protein
LERSARGAVRNWLGKCCSGMTLRLAFWLVCCLLLPHCTVVIDEYKCAPILWIHIALCTLVSGAEVALQTRSVGLSFEEDRRAYRRIIFRKCGLRRRLLLTSWMLLALHLKQGKKTVLPWSLRPVRRDQQPCAPQRIEPSMGYVVQDFIRHVELQFKCSKM